MTKYYLLFFNLSINSQYTLNQIDRCHPYCKACTDINIQSCTSCIDNATFINGVCQCIDGIPIGDEFPGKCISCNPSCKTCNGPSYQDCILCQDGYTNINKICQYNCQDGQYWDQITQTCINCHICCRTCLSDQSNLCHDCHEGFTFNVLNKSCMIYNAACQPCTIALNYLCGGDINSHDECIRNNWVMVNAKICLNCGFFINDACGGNQSEEAIELCNKYGFYNYDGSHCSSCRYVTSNRCGINELQDTCLNNGWVIKDSNTCINCGKFINGACGGDKTEEDIKFCIQKGFINFDNINCFSCMNVISLNCGGNQMKDKCYANGWKIYDSTTCYNCSIIANGQCGIQSTYDTINNCKINGFMNYNKTKCSTCQNVIQGSCGRVEIKERCFNHGWDQYDKQQCIDCNVASPTLNLCICHSTCQTCSRYFNPERCTSCKPSLYFFNGQCLSKCPNGFINNGQNCVPCTDLQIPTCYNCYKTCQICNPFEISLIPNSCIQCSSNTRILLNGECKCKDLEDDRQIFHECSFEAIGVLNAVLSNKYPILSVDFGKYINIPDNFVSEQSSYQLCKFLFIPQTLDLFGSNCECQISKKQILVQLDNDSSIFDGDLIYLNQNILSFMTSPNIIIQKYMNNMVIQEQLIGDAIVKFNSESIFNYCEDINITFNQIINDSKRGFKNFSWSIISFEPSDPIFQTILTNKIKQLNRENGLNLLIQKGIIKPDVKVLIQFNYLLKVNVKRFIQFPISVIIQKKIVIEVQNSFQYPYNRYQLNLLHLTNIYQINSIFSFLNLKRYKNGLIVVSAMMKICKLDGDQIFNDPIKLYITSIQIPDIKNVISPQSNFYYDLEFKPYSLQIGINILKIQANLVSDLKFQSQINYKLQVEQSLLLVKIQGGDGYFNYKNNIVLKSKVRDYDIQNESQPQGINISWQCIEQSSQTPCLNRKQNLIIFPEKQETITIEGYTFVPYTVIKITLIGEKQINRKSINSVSILLSELDLPQLKVSVLMQDPKQETVNKNEELFIEMDYSASINADLLSYSGVIQYKNQVVSAINFDYSKFRFIIQNYFSDFNRDESKFQIRLSVFNPQYTMPSVQTLYLTLNFPPSNCKLIVIPESKIFSQETKILLILDECQDEDQPLQYQFFYYQSPEDFELEKQYPNQIKRKQLSDKSQNFLQEATFPSGQIVILAQAIDSKDAIYNTTKVINVEQKQYNEQSFLSLIQQKIDQSENIPQGKVISELNVVCDEILQRPQFSSSYLLNQQKINIINLLNNIQKNMSSLSTFSTAADKGIISIFKSGIIQNHSEQKEFLNKIINTLDDHSNFKEVILELSKQKLKQNIYDTFQIIDNQQQFEQNFDEIQELFTKIGLYQFKNILPNENPIYFEGNNMTIFSQLITQKYTCYYLICNFKNEQIQESTQTKLYNFTQTEYNSNPYKNDSSFLNYTSQFYNQTTNKKSSAVFPLITPTIDTYQNDSIKSLPNQILLSFPKISESQDSNKFACISKDDLSKQWTKSNCKRNYNDQTKKYECICSKLSPTTIINDIEDLLSNSNVEKAFSSEGISNIANFSNFYKYIIFWLILIQTIEFFSFLLIGNLIDKNDQKFKFKQQNYDKLTQLTTFSLITSSNKNKIFPLNELPDKNDNQQFEKTSQTQKKIITSGNINNQNTCINDNYDQVLDSQILQKKITSSERMFSKEFNSPRSTRQAQKHAKRQKLSKYGIIQQDKIDINQQIQDSINTINTEQKQKEEQQNNQAHPKQQQTIVKTELDEQKNVFNSFQNLSTLKQILIFHNFFGIFYLYNASVARSKRFLVFYIRTLHSLSISIVFDQEYTIVQKVFIAVINAIIIILIIKVLTKLLSFTSKRGIVSSIVIITIIVLGYYYIILAIVSSQSPDESNKFILTFLMFYFGDVIVIAFISAFLQRLISKFILKNLNKQGVIGVIVNSNEF